MIQQRENGVDELVTETRKIRDELVRTSARLQAFADQLAEAAADLLRQGEEDDEQ